MKRPFQPSFVLHPRSGIRALEVLELIGSDEARELLHWLADEAKGSALSGPAKAALLRLDKARKKPE